MIADACKLAVMPEFSGMSIDELKTRLEAVESRIRAYTNNNFQNRKIRFACQSTDVLNSTCAYLKAGDTIEISESMNDGLYVVEAVGNEIRLDRSLYPAIYNLVTKIEYPPDIVEGVVNLLKWDVQNRPKVGIKSETLSRYSVTYYDQDTNNQVMGYPVSLLGFLKPYMKARF